MFTRIDHTMICVNDLAAAQRTYTERLGFHVYPGGDHPGRGTHNAIGFFDLDYIELMGVRDRGELERDPNSGLLDFLAKGDGLRFFILASDDIDADVAVMRSRGVDVHDVREGSRRTPRGALRQALREPLREPQDGAQDSVELKWRFANFGRGTPLPFFIIQHLTPDADRQSQVPRRAPHPNGALGYDHVVVAVTDIEAARAEYQRALGIQPTPVRADALLNAQVCGFPVGKTGVTLATPRGPGPAREALDRRGQGPFLLSFRSGNLQETERWIMSHHINIAAAGALREPQDGVRTDGVRAIVTRPEPAHGVWMAWIG